MNWGIIHSTKDDKGNNYSFLFCKRRTDKNKNPDKSTLESEMDIQNVDNKPVYTKLTTFKGETFGLMKIYTMPPEKRSSGRKEEYHIRIDAINGTILGIAEEVH